MRHAVRVEGLEGLGLLPGTDEFDGFARLLPDGKGRTTTGVAVHLGQDDTVERDALVEGLGRPDRILAGHGIHHEQGLRWLHRLLDPGDLIHHFLVHCEAACGVHDDHVIAVTAGVPEGGLRNFDGVLLFALGEDIRSHALGHDFELVDGGGTVDVTGHEQGPLAVLGTQVQRQFGGVRGLS